MEISDDNHCFVCGALNPCGLQARPVIDAATRSASCRLAVPRAFQGWQGIVHGGILATLLDETCAYAAKAEARQVVTAELHISYKKPVPVETGLLITATIVGERRRILDVNARIEIDGVVHTEAQACMYIVS